MNKWNTRLRYPCSPELAERLEDGQVLNYNEFATRKARTWTEKNGEYGCAECCNKDRCDEDCTATYYRLNCPYCKGNGWFKEIPVIAIPLPEQTNYNNDKKNIKEATQNKVIAVATSEVGAEIIVKALNYYFEKETFTRNESVEMMNTNTADALKRIADLAEKQEMEAGELIDYLREVSEEMAAQALVVSMRDELKFDRTNTAE